MSIKTKLTHSLLQVLKWDNSGSFATRHDRKHMLISFATDLVKMGYKLPNIQSLKLKHIQVVVAYWQSQQLNNATIKNRMSAIRRLSVLIQKPTMVPTNDKLNILPRKYVSEVNRALMNPDFSSISDKHVQASLQLQRVFGLRREESIKIKPHLADRGNELVLNPSWCKGGRGRFVPVRTEEQRYWLDRAKEVAGKYGNSLIPEHRNYIRHRYVYDKQLERADLRNMHGLRHAYAQSRYKALTGWDAPINGGPKFSALTPEQKALDHQARMILTEELGHSRKSVTANYVSR